MNLKDLLKQEFNKINEVDPGLSKFAQVGDVFTISGQIEIKDCNDYVWGKYDVSLIIPPNYPIDLPRLVEEGNAIKRNDNWHINKYGVCCVGTDARQYRDMKDGITLNKWIKLFVIPYLANHLYKKEDGDYVNGELSHGAKGLFEDYCSLFKIDKPIEVIAELSKLLGNGNFSLNAPCFCGSQKKYKNCFLKNVSSHRFGIPYKVLEEDYKKIKIFYR